MKDTKYNPSGYVPMPNRPMMPWPADPVKHPTYYNRGTIEVIDFIRDQELNYNRGAAVKYLCRAGFKDDEITDLRKAAEYISHEIEWLERVRRNGK